MNMVMYGLIIWVAILIISILILGYLIDYDSNYITGLWYIALSVSIILTLLTLLIMKYLW